jgi:hypothetical protein
MISTAHLKADQLTQLEALLADTTPGGGVYRPGVARDVGILWELGQAGLARYVEDVNFETYEITDAGRAIVVDRAMDAASSQAFVSYASNYELRQAIERLKAEAEQLDDDFREYALIDIEACQDELERRAESRSESTGRHRVVPGDDRPTEVLPAAVEQTAIGSSSGTLDGLPCDPDGQATVRLIAAIRATPTPDELAELAAIHTAGWQALEADLADERSWWRRNLTPRRVLALSVIASIVGTWFVAWLVMG